MRFENLGVKYRFMSNKEESPNWFFSLFNSIICGLTQFTNKNHIAFAALEAVCFQTREVKAHCVLN